MLNQFLRKPLLILIVVCLINLTWSGCSEDNYGAVISANHEALAQILDQVCILTVEGIRACIHICNFVFIDLHVCVQISTFVVIDLGVCVPICTLFVIDLRVCVQICTLFVIDLRVCIQICTLFCYLPTRLRSDMHFILLLTQAFAFRYALYLLLTYTYAFRYALLLLLTYT